MFRFPERDGEAERDAQASDGVTAGIDGGAEPRREDGARPTHEEVMAATDRYISDLLQIASDAGVLGDEALRRGTPLRAVDRQQLHAMLETTDLPAVRCEEILLERRHANQLAKAVAGRDGLLVAEACIREGVLRAVLRLLTRRIEGAVRAEDGVQGVRDLPK